ncbi:hypothetical protein OE88DRAFT_1683868, partial [Heliocybe sulcata]
MSEPHPTAFDFNTAGGDTPDTERTLPASNLLAETFAAPPNIVSTQYYNDLWHAAAVFSTSSSGQGFNIGQAHNNFPNPPGEGTSASAKTGGHSKDDHAKILAKSAPTPKRSYTSPRSVSEKLDEINAMLSKFRWTLGEFLYYTFQPESDLKDKKGEPIKRSLSHSQRVASFLGGRSNYLPIQILQAWYKSPYGWPDDQTRALMFSTAVSATDIGPSRPAISSFAAQLVEKQLIKEAEAAVGTSSGLVVKSTSKTGDALLQWSDVGAGTNAEVESLLRSHQPLTWHYLRKIAWRGTERKIRPVKHVCGHVLSILNYSRTHEAKRMALARGLVYFASGAPYRLYRMNSRVAFLPSYSTVLRTLQTLADQAKTTIETLGRSKDCWMMLRLDNVQRYAKQWEASMGQDSQMLKGMAATAIEVVRYAPSAWDVEDKER